MAPPGSDAAPPALRGRPGAAAWPHPHWAWSLQKAQPLGAVTVQMLPYHLLGIVITPRSISLWGRREERKKKNPLY